MAKRLYVREISYRAYVFMDLDETPEDEFDREIVDDAISPDDQSLEPVKVGSNPLGWNLDSLVYHEDSEDFSLKEASRAERGEVEG